MAAAAPRLKRLSLELGGNDAAIVLPDVTEPAIGKMAAKVFQGAFYRSGQVCAAIKRVYVHSQAFDGFVTALGKLADSSVVGDPFDESVTMGPVSNRAQSERVSAVVEQAVAAGGTLVAGGPEVTGPGYFHRPTVVTGVGPDTALVADEQFGPALPVLPYDKLDEAIAAANDTDFGLGGSVWTTDPDRGEEVAARLDAGSVWVNRHGIVTPEVPFGGMKQSGYGRANGSVGLDSYSELKTISVRR
jgi:acyl-CoA reductase-like NAD-dependent aldehyde dehydrogenase